MSTDANALIDSLCRLDVDGRTVPTAHIRIGAGVLDEASSWVEALWGADVCIGLVMDTHTKQAAGESLEKSLSKFESIVLQPRPGWKKITPHNEFCSEIAAATKNCDAYLAVGSGTINDLVKYAAHQENKPYASIATAASMNGYTSSIAALLEDGLKKTIPCAPPCLVLADVNVLAKAPIQMTQSGYSDLLSKNFSTSDWKLGSILSNEVFSTLPWTITDSAIERCVEQADGIAGGETEAVETLMQTLILSGFAMSLAGSSSPASGGEHLISHILDMKAYAADTIPALHGLQVGLGTQLTARLYECVRSAGPDKFRPNEITEEQLATENGDMWPVIQEQAVAMLRNGQGAIDRVEEVRSKWNEIWSALGDIILPASEIRERLKRSGVPTEPEAMGISREKVKFALLHGADMRARYTILHLARDVGLLEELADEVMQVFNE